MKKNILICGEKGVGKSTLIRCLLDATPKRSFVPTSRCILFIFILRICRRLGAAEEQRIL